MKIQHVNPRLPLVWNAPTNNSFFSFQLHTHLAHLARVHCERYERYQVGQGWQFVDSNRRLHIPKGQFIIMRPLDVLDSSCTGLSSLIRRLHARWDTTNLSVSTIPERYRQDVEVGEAEIPGHEAEEDHGGDADQGDEVNQAQYIAASKDNNTQEHDSAEEDDSSREEGEEDTSMSSDDEASGDDDMW